MISRLLLIVCSAVVLGACSREPDARLTRVNELIGEDAGKALAALDSIAVDSLSEADRHYYDLLTVKARDKAYITHTSDSLILDVINYYEGTDFYPEALYYGGRVYSDLGDYPTALDYFHKAIDHLSEDVHDLELRKRLFSQTGRLLTNLRLYDEAVPYIEKSLEIYEQLDDTTNVIYNLQLLGGTYLRAEKYSQAENPIRRSLDLSHKIMSSTHAAKSQMYLAGIKYNRGQVDSALLLIRGVPDAVSPINKTNALAYASNIYLKAGLLDTAYMYSLALINSSDTKYYKNGYQNLLSPELSKFISADSLKIYISDYRNVLESLFDENGSESAINQQNIYNYQLHERRGKMAEQRSENLLKWVTVFVFIIVLLALVILSLKNRNQKRIIELQKALEDIKTLEKELQQRQDERTTNNIGESNGTIHNAQDETTRINQLSYTNKVTENELREELLNHYVSLYKSLKGKPEIDSLILNSEIYHKLVDWFKANKQIKYNDNATWTEIENIVLQSSPKFKYYLNLLAQGKITKTEFRAALLVKCGFKPSEMSILLGRTHGAINSQRNTLRVKVLDENIGVKAIDGIIRLL